MRWLTGAVGAGLMGFGAFRLLTQVPFGDLLVLVVWLGGALVLHDGVLAPATAAAGTQLGRRVPPRARRYVQGGLVTAVVVTSVALPLIARGGSQPPEKALLRQNYPANLGILLAGVGGCTVLLYALRALRSRRPARRTSETNVRPPATHDSSAA